MSLEDLNKYLPLIVQHKIEHMITSDLRYNQFDYPFKNINLSQMTEEQEEAFMEELSFNIRGQLVTYFKSLIEDIDLSWIFSNAFLLDELLEKLNANYNNFIIRFVWINNKITKIVNTRYLIGDPITELSNKDILVHYLYDSYNSQLELLANEYIMGMNLLIK